MEDPVESFLAHGAWNSPGFLPDMDVRNLYFNRFKFAGIVANSRVFRRDKNRYIHFITLGVEKERICGSHRRQSYQIWIRFSDSGARRVAKS